MVPLKGISLETNHAPPSWKFKYQECYLFLTECRISDLCEYVIQQLADLFWRKLCGILIKLLNTKSAASLSRNVLLTINKLDYFLSEISNMNLFKLKAPAIFILREMSKGRFKKHKTVLGRISSDKLLIINLSYFK